MMHAIDPTLLTADAARAAWKTATTTPSAAFGASKRFVEEQPAVAAFAEWITEDQGMDARALGLLAAQAIDALYARAAGGRTVKVEAEAMEEAVAEMEQRMTSMGAADDEFAMQQFLHGFRFAVPAVPLTLLECVVTDSDGDEAQFASVAAVLPLLIAVTRAYERAAGLAEATGSLAGAAAAAGRPMKFGRNDPCPCGSGRKFKKCCWDKVPTAPPKPRADELFERATDGVVRVFDFLNALPLRHPDAVEVRQHFEDVQARFAAGEPGGVPDSHHISEALFDFMATRGRTTIGELYLTRKGRRLDDTTRRTIERLCASYPAFYVLEALFPDEQCKRLRELGTGVEWRVYDVEDPFAEQGEPGEVWLTRLVGTPEEAVTLMSSLIYPPETLEQHDAMAREAIESVAPLDLPAPAALSLGMKGLGELVAQYIVATSAVEEEVDDEEDLDDEEDDR